MVSKALLALRAKHESKVFAVTPMAKRLNCGVSTLQGVLSGSVPKVTVAIALERELGIPIADWLDGTP